MNDVDDRLTGDPVWELFPDPGPLPTLQRVRHWLEVAGLVLVIWFLSPSLAVVTACLATALKDFRTGRQLTNSISDKAGGTICARFTYAWGCLKFGIAAFVLMFITLISATPHKGRIEAPPDLSTAMLLWAGGFALSAALTFSGLLRAYRSGIRVWIGEGVNQARTLMLAMLILGFICVVLGPICLWLVGKPNPRQAHDPASMLAFFGCLFVGPLVILLILDWLSRRVIAEHPGKFGPKVPTIGKWDI